MVDYLSTTAGSMEEAFAADTSAAVGSMEEASVAVVGTLVVVGTSVAAYPSEMDTSPSAAEEDDYQ